MAEEKIFSQPEMEELPDPASAAAAVNSKSDDSFPNDRSASPSSSTKKANTAIVTGRSCTGCLYYSSKFMENSRNPLCVGVSRSLPNVPRYTTEVSKTHPYEDVRSLAGFRYSCVGYSRYKDRSGPTASGKQTQTEMPVCVGVEVLVELLNKSAPSHIPSKEDGSKLPQHHRSPKPTNATGDEFLTRFSRNANLVANGVMKNMRRTGNLIKQCVDDVLHPYRRPPK